MEYTIDHVKERWNQLTAFSKKEKIKDQLWDEVLYHYSAQHRYYHNLTHISHLFALCERYLAEIQNPAIVGFAILYHDIVYDTYRSDNEEQSAGLATRHLQQLQVNPVVIEQVSDYIMATKDHNPGRTPHDKDLALFLDFDMAVLAEEQDYYDNYREMIRKEYAKYPDTVYREGRKIALQKILSAPSIFVTDFFRRQKEVKARENINKELELL